MAGKPPVTTPPSNERTLAQNTRRFLLYGFGISILLHLLFGPLVGFKNAIQEQDKKEVVRIEKKPVKVVTPKPTPTPPPIPTPTPQTNTPPPQTPPPHQVRLKVDVPKTHSENSGPSEQQYNVKSGSQEGIPQGTAATGPPAAPPAAAPTPTPVPTPTPAQCANPNLDASATDKVSPDMPEIARQMGATGVASVRVSLDAAGKVLSVSIYKSTGNRALDNAALDAAKQSRYRAEVRNCVPVAGSYLYTVAFESQ